MAPQRRYGSSPKESETWWWSPVNRRQFNHVLCADAQMVRHQWLPGYSQSTAGAKLDAVAIFVPSASVGLFSPSRHPEGRREADRSAGRPPEGVIDRLTPARSLSNILALDDFSTRQSGHS